MDRRVFFIVWTALMGCSAARQTAVRAAAPAAPCVGGAVAGDAELERYAGCRVIAGRIDVRGVTSLAPLRSLERVDGTLCIERTDRLYSLSGLERLRSVGTLEIRDNTALISGGALRGLDRVQRAHLSHNPRLSKTYGLLDAIVKGGGDVYLAHNSGLTAEGVRESEAPSATLALR